VARYRYVEQELGLVRRAGSWNPRLQRILKAAPLVVAFLLLNTRSAGSATCSFNPTPDPTVDGSANSLRHTVQLANASGQDCVITLRRGTYTLTIKNTDGHENAAKQGDLDIAAFGHRVTIQGVGTGGSVVNGNGIDRVFHVLAGVGAVFRNLTIERGIARDDGKPGTLPGTSEARGGGILVEDAGVSLDGVKLTGNFALGGSGATGPSFLPGTPGQLGAGGGLYVSSGSIVLSFSTVSGNAAIGGVGGSGGHGSTTPSGGCLSAGAGGAGQLGAGGGLYVSSGSVQLWDSTVSANQADGGPGGSGGPIGIACGGSFGGSAGHGDGGGLFVSGGTLALRSSIVSGNSVMGADGGPGSGFPHQGGDGGSSQGAGMFVAAGSVSLANSTIFGNAAKNGGNAGTSTPPGFGFNFGGDSAGGGLFVSAGSVNLAGVTIASNRVGDGGFGSFGGSSLGGGICNSGATRLVSDSTLIANNTQGVFFGGSSPDIAGAITSSFSLISQTAGAIIANKGHNILGVGPLLDPGGLRQNGGPTETVAVEQGSQAIDAGDNVICQAPPPRGLGSVDQRGFVRARSGDTRCDIGAFEFVDLTVLPTLLNFASEVVGKVTAAQTVSLINNQTTVITLKERIEGANPNFIETKNTCGITLGSHTSCTISIAFKPTTTGARFGLLTVSDNPDLTTPYHVLLIGTGATATSISTNSKRQTALVGGFQ
jgi:hypothetical protein